MDAAILPVISQIIDRFGNEVFTNMGRTNAMLLDLAPGMNRERILVRNFVEAGGFTLLLHSKEEYSLIKNNVSKTLIETFCMEPSAACWVVHLFGVALGYETEDEPLPYTEKPAWVIPKRNSLVAIGKAHVAAVAADGTLFANGSNIYFQCDVKGWRHITAVAAGDNHTVGLQSDGSCVACGSNNYDQCDVGEKNQVASIYASGNDTVFIHSDGTVTATGRTAFNLSAFTDIKSIARYPEGLLGIRDDGCVLASEDEVDEEIEWIINQEDVEQVITTYVNGCIVLKKDGRIYKDNHPENYFAPWRDIISIVDLSDSFAILRMDGTVRVLSYNREQARTPCDAENWTNIIALYGRYKRLIGLTADGQLLTACTDPEWLKRNGSIDFVQRWYPVGGW